MPADPSDAAAPGVLITLEGGEGAGKSTQANLLKEHLEAVGLRPVVTREPGGTSLGEVVRRLLKRPAFARRVYERWSKTQDWSTIHPLSELFIFAAARAQLVAEVIIPALARGDVIICDRFTDSTLAYQGFGRGLDLDLLRLVNRAATQGISPDLTVLLDLPVEVGLARHVATRGEHFARQPVDFHQRVRQGYLELARAEPARFFVVDAVLPPDDVARRIWERVWSLIEARR